NDLVELLRHVANVEGEETHLPGRIARHREAGLKIEASRDEEKRLLPGERRERGELRSDVVEHLADLRPLLLGVASGEECPRGPSTGGVDVPQGLPLGQE